MADTHRTSPAPGQAALPPGAISVFCDDIALMLGAGITLDEAGNISTVETGFTVQGLEQKLVFTISDIGTTSIPASADFPNA